MYGDESEERKASLWNPTDLGGLYASGRFVVSWTGEAYDARAIGQVQFVKGGSAYSLECALLEELPRDTTRKERPAMKLKKERIEKSERNSRRGFLKSSVGLVAGVAAAQWLPERAAAQQSAASPVTLESLRNPNGRAILLKGGIVLSMDSQVGDFEKAEVLIQGKKVGSGGRDV